MVNEESTRIQETPKVKPQKQHEHPINGEKVEALFSPRFRSVAEMAGWDEEALLIASLVVEDTPERQPKQKKRPDLLHFKTPPTSSRRKRRAQKRSPASIPVTVLDLDQEDTAKQEIVKKKTESNTIQKADKRRVEGSKENGSSGSAIPCVDRLREELSCAICLEICFEPSTTPCGHSFCKKCLRSAADKCGKKCPKCRQLISNARSCTVNTVLWNTIQLLFPKEVEARKAAGALNGREAQCQSTAVRAVSHSNVPTSRITRVLALNSPEPARPIPKRRNSHSMTSQRVQPSGMSSSTNEDISLKRRRTDEEYKSSLALARANLRVMATRAINNIRLRGRGT